MCPMRAVTKTVLGLGVAGAGVLGWASLVERNAFVLQIGRASCRERVL